MVNNFAQMKKIRHNRVLDIRKKISLGWKIPDLIIFCTKNLGVTKLTANSYIDKAAEPYRKKYQKDQELKNEN